jgi:TRAP-type C4-dicarboxylate transport system permease small subunit
MNRILKFFTKALEYFLSLLLAMMVFTVFTQVLSRMIFKVPVGWSEELSRFGFIWLVFLSSALAIIREEHFRILIFTEKFPFIIKKYLDIIAKIIGLFFSVYMTWYGFLITKLTWAQLSPAMQISMGIAYMVLPVSGVLMVIFSLYKITENILKKE